VVGVAAHNKSLLPTASVASAPPAAPLNSNVMCLRSTSAIDPVLSRDFRYCRCYEERNRLENTVF
jgi:hypothetical protein